MIDNLAEAVLRPVCESICRLVGDRVNRWMLDGQADAALTENGRLIARFAPRVRLVISIATGVSAFFLILVLIAAPGVAKWFSLPFLLFLIAAILGLLDAMYTRFEFTRDELFVQTFWKGRRLIPWAEVESPGYSVWCSRAIDAGPYGRITISPYLTGCNCLIDLVRAKLRDRKKTV
jgi:hypothetical protein